MLICDDFMMFMMSLLTHVFEPKLQLWDKRS